MFSINKSFFVFFLVFLVNVLIFRNHIFGDYGFPWDFNLSYHAIPYYWLNALKFNGWPAWIPFQGMGYSSALNLQTGLFYLPFYLFYIFDIPYTLKAAVLFQVAHIFIGALGMYIFLRKVNLDYKYALIGAVAFNLFGGFFSNASHPDIVRSFAFVPWLLAAMYVVIHDPKPIFGLVVLPLIVYAQWSGGYPGASISQAVVIFLFCFFSCFRRNVRYSRISLLLALFCLGLMIAAPAFLPALLAKNEIGRSANAIDVSKTFLEWSNYLSLIYPIDLPVYSGDITMRSMHIPIVPLIFILFINRKNIIQYREFVLLILVIGLFASGGFLYQSLTNVFHFLGYSRYVIADYRGYVAVPLIFLSVQGLKNARALGKDVWRDRFVFGIVLVIVLFFIADTNFSKPVYLIEVAFLLGLVFYSYRYLCNRGYETGIFLVLFILLQVIDFARIHHRQGYWRSEGVYAAHRATYGSLSEISSVLKKRLAGEQTRSHRNNLLEESSASIAGYLQGEFMISDYSGPMKFKIQQSILNNPLLVNYAVLSWKPIVFQEMPSADVALEAIKNIDKTSSSKFVTTIKYAPNRINYNIESNSGFWFIENEIFQPGWSMRINDTDSIVPIDYYGFRLWKMPAGKYSAVAVFEQQHLKKSMFISIFGFVLFLIFILVGMRKIGTENNDSKSA